MEGQLEEIVLDDDTVLKVDESRDYGTSHNYFAIVGNDLYYPSTKKDRYTLLKKDYKEVE